MSPGNDIIGTDSSDIALREHRARFGARFGDPDGVRVFFAPGRVNLMGAHLDYNGGPVMPMAIDRGTFVALRPRADATLTLASMLDPFEYEGPIDALPTEALGRWVDYPIGVIRALARRAPFEFGADVLFGGNLPIGAGLSSSASICVGTAFSLDAVFGRSDAPRDLIEAALWSEREFVGVKCGIMDPFAVTLARPGHLLWIDCGDESVEHIPIDANEVTIAVADTGVRRELAQGAFNERVAQCALAFEALVGHAGGATSLAEVSADVVERHAHELEPPVLRRAQHVVAEVARTHAAKAALLAGDLAGFGSEMTAAHKSLRDLFEVSIPELDVLVEAAVEWDGVFGTRLTGAGFGGCIVVVMRTSSREGFREHLEAAYRGRFDRSPDVEFFGVGAGPREVLVGPLTS